MFLIVDFLSRTQKFRSAASAISQIVRARFAAVLFTDRVCFRNVRENRFSRFSRLSARVIRALRSRFRRNGASSRRVVAGTSILGEHYGADRATVPP